MLFTRLLPLFLSIWSIYAKSLPLTAEEEDASEAAILEIDYAPQDTLEQIIKDQHTLIVFFGASWCPNTKRLNPKYLEVQKRVKAEKFEEKGFKMVKIECKPDHGHFCTHNYHITGYPTLLAFSNGRLLGEYPFDHQADQIYDYIKKLVETHPRETGAGETWEHNRPYIPVVGTLGDEKLTEHPNDKTTVVHGVQHELDLLEDEKNKAEEKEVETESEKKLLEQKEKVLEGEEKDKEIKPETEAKIKDVLSHIKDITGSASSSDSTVAADDDETALNIWTYVGIGGLFVVGLLLILERRRALYRYRKLIAQERENLVA
ncbi:thioredoxin-like protein [Globomyces pollinis-pini]|nr:thioredoxin-like protein [Globomyces pollinis-pini]KAJ2996660.1 protein disulfide-isomerase precursor [Globomyces sp. JEL0801]